MNFFSFFRKRKERFAPDAEFHVPTVEPASRYLSPAKAVRKATSKKAAKKTAKPMKKTAKPMKRPGKSRY